MTSPLVCPVHKFLLLQAEAALHSLCLYLAGGIFYQVTVTALDRWHWLTFKNDLKFFSCHLRGVLTFLLFKSRLLWRYSIIPAGVDYYYPEGFTVAVLENESPGCNCYGINCKTNKLSSTSISGNDTECFGARPGWKNMGRKGKRSIGFCIFV